METLIARVRTSEDWDESIADDILSTIQSADRDGSLGALRSQLDGEPKPDTPSQPLLFLSHLAAAKDTGDAVATDRVAALLESLNQRKRWGVLGRLSIGVATLLSDASFCKYVARVGEEGGLERLEEDILDRAIDLAPDNHRLLWLKARQLEELGEAGARRYYARSMWGWAHAKDLDKLDDAILKLVEHPDPDEWRLAWSALEQLAKHGENRPMLSFLELGMSNLEKAGLLDQVWTTLRDLLDSDQATRKIRRLAASAAVTVYKKLASIQQVVDRSGLGDPAVPLKKALGEFDRLLKYAPGLLVIHANFGAGTIVDNDGEMVTIDFPEKASHKMSLTIADRSLDILPPDDLRTFILTDADRIKKMAKSDPVELLALALSKLGGSGNNADVRKILVPDVLSAQSWPAWWKRATTAAKDDARIDTSQTFRRVYRVVEAGTVSSLLPPIQERADLHQNVDMIFRFLSQHPEQEEEARRVYRPRLVNWLSSSDKPEARVHLLHVLRRWDDDAAEPLHDELRRLVEGGGDFTFTSLEVEQIDLLKQAEAIGLGTGAALAAFPCRNRGTRAEAARVFNEILGNDADRALRELYSRAPKDENRILGLIEFALEDPDAVSAALKDPWYALRALVAIVHAASREPARKHALSLLKTNSPLGERLASPPDEERRMLLLKQLTTWRTTDRVLFPILDFLDAAGHGDIVDAVRRERSVQSAEFVAKDKDGDAGIYMTRDALHRLRDQIEKIEVALRTTIPEAIRTAREHGDLSENAEYHAAKEKQARENQRLSQLQELIGKARVIEDASRADGVAAPGTLVRAVDLTTNTESEYWILGEGDAFHGSNVISYRAPLGFALAGHRVGEDVTVFLEGGERHLRIVEVSEKLP